VTVAGNWWSDGGQGGIRGCSSYSSGLSNSFKNITALSGNVVLIGGLDTYKNFFYQPPSTITGGTQVPQGR
jgi:hypothetical protein